MTLSTTFRRALKANAHHLKPVILTGGKGLSQSLLTETDRALFHHELIKIRLHATDRQERQQWIEEICTKCHADLVATVGHIAILYRENPDKGKYSHIAK